MAETETDRIALLERRVRRLQIVAGGALVVALGAIGGVVATTFVLKPATPKQLVFVDGNQRTTIDASGIRIRGETGAFGAGPGAMTIEDVKFGTVQVATGSLGLSNKDASITLAVRGDAPVVSGAAGRDTAFRLEAAAGGSQLALTNKTNAIHLHTDATSYPLHIMRGDKSFTLPVAEPSTK